MARAWAMLLWAVPAATAAWIKPRRAATTPAMSIQIRAVVSVAWGFWRSVSNVGSPGAVVTRSQVCQVSERFMMCGLHELTG